MKVFFAMALALVMTVTPLFGQDQQTTPVAPSASTAPIGERPQGFVLEDGTPVHLILSETISSHDAQVGQTVSFETVEDILIDGIVVVPKGATAWATVTQAQGKRMMGRAGKLDMNIDKVRLVDGEKILLRAVKATQAGGHQGAVVGGVVAGAIIFWPAAPLFLMIHGKDITIAKGTPITAFVQGDNYLDKTKFVKSPAVSPVL
jgi:hypothetical protein